MKKDGGQHAKFWNKEYKTGTHLALSTNPSEDLEKFTRWLERTVPISRVRRNTSVLDLGCGNGRNLVYLAETYGAKGVGYDSSAEAIAQAKKLSGELPLTYEVRSIAGPIPLPDESCHLILDMMTSHFLRAKERILLRDEVIRLLPRFGFFFFKTFCGDEDLHVSRLLNDHPADEPGAYIHPRMGVYEYVWREEDIYSFFNEAFIIHKIVKSHKHTLNGKAWKRRTMSVYLEKR